MILALFVFANRHYIITHNVPQDVCIWIVLYVYVWGGGGGGSFCGGGFVVVVLWWWFCGGGFATTREEQYLMLYEISGTGD